MTETEQVMVRQMYIHSAKLSRMTLKRVVPISDSFPGIEVIFYVMRLLREIIPNNIGMLFG